MGKTKELLTTQETKDMKIRELIKQLQEIEDQDREVSIVIGNEDNNSMVFDEFELHNTDDNETSVEVFCFDNYMFEQDYCYSIRDINNAKD